MSRREARTWRPWHYAVLGLLGLAGVVLLVWWVPPALYDYVDNEKDRAAAEASTRTGIIAGLAGLAALGGLAITARTYRLTEQGHITERYTKAIEQLGQAELAVRLGGLYALERIAVDSERDHPTVVEVLSAFIREGSRKQGTPRAGQGTVQQAAETDTPAPESDATPRPPTDIQAALTVLGRLPQRPEIPRADLSEAQLSGAQLQKANLSGAQLDGANLSGAQLEKANLSEARLDGANLSGADLIWADLSGAWLADVDLSGAQLLGANLSRARLGKANMSEARLIGANLSDAHLEGADLSGAWLERANLTDAHLEGADLSGAWLIEADLSGARLKGAVLRQTIGLTQEQLDAARGDARTWLPDGRRPGGSTAEDDPTASSS
jgi:uncharacterized protein YjbI with pentapeptide repeats